MSKGTSHYNWQKWISQTDLSKKEIKNKKVLKEMNQRWINAVMPAVLAATKRKNDNFKLFFGEEGNRIVIPYDEGKMIKLAALIRVCANLLFEDTRSTEKIAVYKTKLFKTLSKDPNFDLSKLSQPQREEFLSKIPPYMKNYLGILNYPFVNIDSLNIRQNVVKQKFTPLGGGAPQEKDVTYYEPVIEYTIKTPLNPIMGQDFIEKHLKENPDMWGNGSYTSKSYTATIGQVLQKFKEKELFDWWQQNQLKFSQDKDTIEGAKELIENEGFFLGADLDRIKKKFNEVTNTEVSNLSILISSAPIDVLRMSDFASKGMTSCHREGGEYFYCALAEARNQGAIAYLVKTEDINKVDLNATEIFADPQRKIEGILPEARVRLRRVIDNTTGVDFMAPETRIYGRAKVSFVDTVNKWVTQKTAKILLNDPEANYDEGKFYIPDADAFELKGGSYSDSGMRGLGSSLIRIIYNASKLISQSDEEKNYLDDRVEMLESGFSSYGISYTGVEDEDEANAPCKTAKEEAQQMVLNFDRRADFASVSVDVQCDDDDFHIDVITSQINIELQIDRRDDGIQFNQDRLNEVLGTEYLKQEVIEKFKYLFDSMLRGVDDRAVFTSSDIDVNVQLFSGPQIFIQILIMDTHPSSDSAEMHLIGARETLNKLDYRTDIRDMVVNHFRNIGVIIQPPISRPEIQDMIQKFAEDLSSTGSHAAWLESEEGQWDQFIIVENPARETVSTNYPIVAKIPTPKPTANQAELSMRVPISDFALKKDMIRQIIDTFTFIDTWQINQEFNKQFGSSNENANRYDNKQKPLFSFGDKDVKVADPIKTQNVDITPVVDDSFEIKIMVIDDDVQKALEGADYLNVRAKITVKISENFTTQQEIINATNFIEKIGKEENYQKMINICSDAVNKTVKEKLSVQPGEPLSYYDRQKQRTAKAIEASVASPNEKQPQQREVEGPLFSGNPMYKDQRLPENKNRKLVINERFKRLLRNTKK
jgi:hypothetical protein